jgi:hypothetical protein
MKVKAHRIAASAFFLLGMCHSAFADSTTSKATAPDSSSTIYNVTDDAQSVGEFVDPAKLPPGNVLVSPAASPSQPKPDKAAETASTSTLIAIISPGCSVENAEATLKLVKDEVAAAAARGKTLNVKIYTRLADDDQAASSETAKIKTAVNNLGGVPFQIQSIPAKKQLPDTLGNGLPSLTLVGPDNDIEWKATGKDIAPGTHVFNPKVLTDLRGSIQVVESETKDDYVIHVPFSKKVINLSAAKRAAIRAARILARRIADTGIAEAKLEGLTARELGGKYDEAEKEHPLFSAAQIEKLKSETGDNTCKQTNKAAFEEGFAEALRGVKAFRTANLQGHQINESKKQWQYLDGPERHTCEQYKENSDDQACCNGGARVGTRVVNEQIDALLKPGNPPNKKGDPTRELCKKEYDIGTEDGKEFCADTECHLYKKPNFIRYIACYNLGLDRDLALCHTGGHAALAANIQTWLDEVAPSVSERTTSKNTGSRVGGQGGGIEAEGAN